MYVSQLIAADAVQKVLNGQNLTVSLPKALALYPQATQQQKGGGADLSYGTLRHVFTLRFFLKQLLKQPLTDQRVEALLLVALYQLQFDDAKPFTVVNQVVKAVTRLQAPTVKAWAKGLVNAVCRNFQRQQAKLNEAAQADLVTQFSYPYWWIKAIQTQYPDHWQGVLNTGNAHPPMTLRVASSVIPIKDYMAKLDLLGMQAERLSAEAIMLARPVPVSQLPGFEEGLVSVQDYGAQLAAHLLDLKTNQRVLDACSAPGGKATHCLQLANVHLTVLDYDAERLNKVQQNLDRLKLSANVLCGDAAKQDWWDGKKYDRILADVPCSASGIVRRHVDMKSLRRVDDVVRFSEQQAKILANLWQMLEKGGKLLYATCSIFESENQRQIDRFLLNTPDAQLVPTPLMASTDFPNILYQGQQLIPNEYHDGFYYALIQKMA